MIGTAILMAILTTVEIVPDKTAEDLEAKWRREYPTAAEGWESVAEEFMAKGRFSFRWFNGTTTTTKDLTVASSGHKKLFIRDRKEFLSRDSSIKPEVTDVQCETSKYAFFLTREPSASQYLVVNYRGYKEDDESRFQYHHKIFARGATVFLVFLYCKGCGARHSY